MAVATSLQVADTAFAHAIQVALEDGNARIIRAHLDPTPRAHFDEAVVWTRSNDKLIARLRDQPETLMEGLFDMNEARGWLARLFGIGARKSVDVDDDELSRVAASAVARAKGRSTADDEKRAKLRALVDDAFDA